MSCAQNLSRKQNKVFKHPRRHALQATASIEMKAKEKRTEASICRIGRKNVEGQWKILPTCRSPSLLKAMFSIIIAHARAPRVTSIKHRRLRKKASAIAYNQLKAYINEMRISGGISIRGASVEKENGVYSEESDRNINIVAFLKERAALEKERKYNAEEEKIYDLEKNRGERNLPRRWADTGGAKEAKKEKYLWTFAQKKRACRCTQRYRRNQNINRALRCRHKRRYLHETLK